MMCGLFSVDVTGAHRYETLLVTSKHMASSEVGIRAGTFAVELASADGFGG